MRHYGKSPPSKAYNRTALLQLLTLRASVVGLSVDSLARSYGVSIADVEKMIATEVERRAVG